jgi:glycosyltransferase involved in cell wall biosynthesis
VTLPGTSTNPYPAIAAADLLVSSSRYEGFSNAIVEAHALGIPVVATDCPSANREVIDPGVNGWLAPTEDATGLADTIDGALATIHAVDPRLIAVRCQERFAVSTVMAEYEEVFACRARP